MYYYTKPYFSCSLKNLSAKWFKKQDRLFVEHWSVLMQWKLHHFNMIIMVLTFSCYNIYSTQMVVCKGVRYFWIIKIVCIYSFDWSAYQSRNSLRVLKTLIIWTTQFFFTMGSSIPGHHLRKLQPPSDMWFKCYFDSWVWLYARLCFSV